MNEYTIWTSESDPLTHIGYLENGHFVCRNCNVPHENPADDVRVYLINITPYKQTCHACGRLVVQGKTPAWVELFD